MLGIRQELGKNHELCVDCSMMSTYINFHGHGILCFCERHMLMEKHSDYIYRRYDYILPRLQRHSDLLIVSIEISFQELLKCCV